MKKNKKQALVFGLFLTLCSLSSQIYAKESPGSDSLIKDLRTQYPSTTIVAENDNSVQLNGNNAEEIEKIVNTIMQKYRADGAKKPATPGEISPLDASWCTSECNEAFRYDSKTTTTGNAENLAQVQGYHWSNGNVKWTSVGGSTITKWTGSGTAKIIGHTLTLNVSAVSLGEFTPPSSFKIVDTSKNIAEWKPSDTSYSNVKASTFNGGSADSWIFLGDMTFKSDGRVQDPNGYDHYVTATAVIN
ncbi:hypothetical protein [Paenibacillus oleatilyticus]|uniref:Uncharacterized protein n=1 Tax=Paenibacillus oleatilyticus TaxID=2594886 RepID=A0ABV4V1U8_9BACL